MKRKLFTMAVILGLSSTTTTFAYDREYNIGEGDVSITSAGDYLVFGSDPATVIGNIIEVAGDLTSAVNITLRDVNITANGSAFLINENTTVNLVLSGENTLKGNGGCGIQTNGSINISGSGSLVAEGGGNRGAGIGQLSNTAMGDITISGGKITARSTTEATGIGGGNGGQVGTVTISGGIISATGGYYASGIGGGYVCSGGSVVITGGTIVARAGTYLGDNNGIGKGTGHNGMTVTITGGSIKTLDNGGSFRANGILPTPKNADDENLELFQYAIPGITEATPIYGGNVGSIVLNQNYGINSTYTDEEGNLYFYLIPQDPGVEVNINTTYVGIEKPSVSKNLVNIYTKSGKIVLEGASGKKIAIYDSIGRVLEMDRISGVSETINIPQKGLYIIKVEGDKAYKVLVQ